MNLPSCIQQQDRLLLIGISWQRQQLFQLRALARDLPSADQVGKLTVFNISGNKVRLIAAIHYNRGRIYIRAVLTHAEYDEKRWKE